MSNRTEPGASLVDPGGIFTAQPSCGSTGLDSIPPLKRVVDIVFAVSALVFFLPVMVCIGLTLRLREGGPIFFAHPRVGQAGQMFKCLKFRTMVPDAQAVLDDLLANDPVARAEWDATQKLTNDPRISCLGKFLRKSSLDELPQFWNVLRGDMSIVGPRPIIPEEMRHYREHIAEYKSVRPGITGNWQVNGRSTTTYAERVAMDVDYVRHPSITRDIGIILKTVKVVLATEGAR